MIQNSHLALLELHPLNPDAAVEKIILGVDKKNHLVKEMTLFNVSGNKTHYIFSKIKLNLNLNDHLFEFKKTDKVQEVRR